MIDPCHDEADVFRDSVTGLPGVDTVRARLGQWLRRAADQGEPPRIHALLLGLRRFDTVNLAYGSAAGDGALGEVAARICHFAANELDGAWHVARDGGSNFLLVADEACSRERWQLFAEQLADAVTRPIALPAGIIRLYPRAALLRGLAGEDVDSMLDRLGHTLESVMRMQGRRIAWAEGETTLPGYSSAQLEADLLSAIDRDEIEVVFQPQFSLSADGLAGDRLVGAEALARWNHPGLGRIGAGALFTIAERTDQVTPLSRHIARRAMQVMPGDLRLSLNVTPSDLAAANYANQLMGIIADAGFPPERLTLEVTEQTLVHDIHLAARTTAELASHGIRIALDDFGAGFCNFRYLKLLPLHYLKLDRSMIDGITSDARDLAVLRAIIAMAGALDLRVIAEGIEHEDQRDLIAREGCAFYQGFLRAAPMSAADFAAMAVPPGA